MGRSSLGKQNKIFSWPYATDGWGFPYFFNTLKQAVID